MVRKCALWNENALSSVQFSRVNRFIITCMLFEMCAMCMRALYGSFCSCEVEQNRQIPTSYSHFDAQLCVSNCTAHFLACYALLNMQSRELTCANTRYWSCPTSELQHIRTSKCKP